MINKYAVECWLKSLNKSIKHYRLPGNNNNNNNTALLSAGVSTILTSSGFPRTAAVVEHSLLRKSSVNLLAGKLVSKSIKGIFLSA